VRTGLGLFDLRPFFAIRADLRVFCERWRGERPTTAQTSDYWRRDSATAWHPAA
jgi:hypothetical protein